MRMENRKEYHSQAVEACLATPMPGFGPALLWNLAIAIIAAACLILCVGSVSGADISSDDPPPAKAAQGRLLLREVYDLDGKKVAIDETTDKPAAAAKPKARPAKIPCGTCGPACDCTSCDCDARAWNAACGAVPASAHVANLNRLGVRPRPVGVGQANPTTPGTTAPVVVLPSTSSQVSIPMAPTYTPAPAAARRGGISFGAGFGGPFGGGFSAGCASGG
jgi:hypothetical protein